jgi:magnesium transporter
MKALESMLMHGITDLELELQSQLNGLNQILGELENHIDRDLLRTLLIRNRAMVKFHQKCNLVRLAIEDVLENDEALIGLYLTESTYDVCRVVSSVPLD